MKKREWVLVVALILFGLVYQGVEKGRLELFGDFSLLQGDSRLLSDKYIDFPRPSQRFDSVAELEVINPAGEIEVRKGMEPQPAEAPLPAGVVEAVKSESTGLVIDAVVRVFHDNRTEAEAIAKSISVTARPEGSGMRLEVRSERRFPLNRVRVLLKIQAPESIKLSLTNSFGDLHLSDVGRDVYLNESFGHLFVDNLPSDLRVENRHGNLLIRNVTGKIEVVARYADVNIEGAAALHLQNSHGKMVVKNVRGPVVAEHAYGGLFLDGAERAEIEARHADLELRNVRNGAKISDSYEQVKLLNTNGDIRISGRYCSINLNGCAAGAVVIGNTFNDINLENLSARNLEITQKHGQIRVQLADLKEKLVITNSYAGIDVTLPPSLDPGCTLKTEFGTIDNQSGLPLEFHSDDEDVRTATRTGSRGQVLISNYYGDIHLRRL